MIKPIHMAPARPPVSGKEQTRFKGGLPLSPVTQMFHFFETSYEPGFILVSKVIGNILPRLAITRTKEELSEVAFNEATQTAGFFVTLPVASALLNPIQGALANIPTKLIQMRNEEAFARVSGDALKRLQVAKLGKSLGVLSFIFFLKIAMPYIRNWRTIAKTGFSDFKQLVALGGKQEPTPEQKARAVVDLKKNRNITLGLIAAGAVLAAGVMGWAGMIARGGNAIFRQNELLNPKRLSYLVENFALVGKNSNQVMSLTKSGKQALWFWGVPSYIGWFMGCRDKFEVMEQVSKFGTFLVGYMGMNPLMKAVMKKVDKKLLDEVRKIPGVVKLKAGKEVFPFYHEVISKNVMKSPGLTKRYLTHLNKTNGYALLANLFVVGALPLVFNVYFTAWRFKREQAEKKAQEASTLKRQAPPEQTPPITPKPARVEQVDVLPPPQPVSVSPVPAYPAPWPSYPTAPYHSYPYSNYYNPWDTPVAPINGYPR